jgi:hypothetical protein
VPGLTPPKDTDPANYFGQQRDYGDLPSPLYNGVLPAYHVFANQNLRMGAAIDAEPVAQPNGTATGDDLGGIDDEDGVTIPASIIAGQSTTFTVNATNTSGAAATLYGFVDWSGDGDFLDANETATAAVANGFSGNAALTFNVPIGAVIGQDLGARFRISTDAGLTATNNATNGEVEDYLVRVSPQRASLGNYVWEDLDADGIQDGNEPGVEQVKVTLTGGGADGLISTPGDNTTTNKFTDASGFYLFDNLNPGEQYQVSFEKPGAYISFTKADATGDATDSDANVSTGVTPVVVLTPGQYNDTIDAGLLKPAKLGDFVWRDSNGNGVQDLTEAGVQNVKVTITGTDVLGNPVNLSKLTDINGGYLFDNLVPGTYKVTFSDLPAGLAFTARDQGGNDGKDSDADAGTGGMTPNVVLGSGGSNLTLDAGLVGTGIDIIKFVNGQDANNATGPILVVGSTATFTYEVRNTGNVSLASVTVSDDNGTPGNLGDDFAPAFTGGDANANNLLDVGEVWAYSATRTVVGGQYTNIASTTGTPVYPPGVTPPGGTPGTPVPGLTPPKDTDPANYFGQQRDYGDLPSPLYNGVLPAYHVFANQNLRMGAAIDAEPVAQPNGTATGDDLGGIDDEDGVTIPASIIAGQSTTFTVNATNTSGAAATLYGFVDWSGDGDFLDANETATAAVANGFSGNAALTFNVPIGAVIGQDLGARFRISTDAGLTATNNATNGEVEDYLVRVSPQRASLGNYVWEDLDADGIQDGNEPGVEQVKVTLTGGGADGLISTPGDNTTTNKFTDASGFYLFDNLNPGEQYQVSFEKPGAYISFTKADATGDATDSDANVSTGVTPVVVLTPGQYNDTIDAGLLKPAKLGDFVWRDSNGNGVQDLTEAGVQNVKVTITGTDVLGNPVNLSKLTDINGGYLFDNLVPGTYKVTFSDLPAGLAFTARDQGGNDGKDSDADAGTGGMTPNVVLGSGGSNLTLDAGLVGTGIDIIKFVNGQDANNATGPILVVGSTATFTYEVRNTGNVSLASVTVSDDNGTPGNLGDDFAPAFTGGDANANNLLDVGEVWAYSATRTVVGGQYTNIASTTGTPVYPPGVTPPGGTPGTPVPGLTPPKDTDPANYFGQQRDYGDLPSPLYNGVLPAYHVFANQNLRMGAAIDAEPVAQPNGTATGDDLGGIDDEDGVTIPASIIAGQSTTFTVNATNTSGAAATLYGFVDWSGDGDFLDANETATAAVANGFSGNAALTFNVPIGAVIGQDLGARFRISTDAGLTATNNATNGEVEDYLVRVSPAVPGIDIEKKTNGSSNTNPTAPNYDNEDAPNGAGVPILTPGSDVTWTYKVTNTGNTNFARSAVAVVDDNGTSSNAADDLSIANGKIIYQSGDDGDNVLEPGESWLYKATGTVQTLTTPGVATTFDFSGNSATDGPDGNTRTYTVDGITVNANAWSRVKSSDTWDKAFLGAYGGGHGVTDISEGTGSGDSHTVDNNGRDNYIVYQFSQNVVMDKAFLGYVVGDSDMTVYIGTVALPITTMNNAVLANMSVKEFNDTTSTSARWADFNAGNVSGNVLIIAARDDGHSADYFKVDQVVVQPPQSSIYENKATVSTGVGGPTDSDLSHYKNPAAVVPAQIGNLVWCDTNGNGIQDKDEPGVKDVEVKLLKAADHSVVASTKTDSSGNYGFTVAPGDYYVQFVKPTAFGGFTKANQGVNDSVDSDADVNTGKTAPTTLVAGENDTSWDAGLTPPKVTLTYDFSGSSATDGTDGNTRTLTVDGVIVTARAVSRHVDAVGNVKWEAAWLGAYGGGLGVTDKGEGTGGGDKHTVDNVGRGNYVLFQFSQKVVVDKTFLGYVVDDSDLTAWVGSSATTLTNLSDAVLNGMTKEDNDTTSTTARWADINGGSTEGNVLVIAASTSDKTPDDYFKVDQLVVRTNSAKVTPIAIDLDGGGIQTVASEDAGGTFDLLGNGQPVASGWLAGGEGFLALDSNGNGKIDSISELFGGSRQGDGFAKLATVDSNGDGVVDASDAGYVDLSVWRDANGNHQTDLGELMRLAEAGVVSLDLDYVADAFMDANGNLHLEQSSATMSDGRLVDMTDVYFAVAANDAAAPVGQATVDPGWLFA